MEDICRTFCGERSACVDVWMGEEPRAGGGGAAGRGGGRPGAVCRVAYQGAKPLTLGEVVSSSGTNAVGSSHLAAPAVNSS